VVDICGLKQIGHQLNVFLVFQAFTRVGLCVPLFIVGVQKLSGLEGLKAENAFVIKSLSWHALFRL
jgi:hypothetical protein